MKLDYLENTNEDYPQDMLVRLFEFNEIESRKLIDTIREMLSVRKKVSIHNLDFVHSEGCKLHFEICVGDVGIERVSKSEFVCKLTDESFRTMISLVEPFTEKATAGHYQWLYNLVNRVDLLYSPTGEW